MSGPDDKAAEARQAAYAAQRRRYTAAWYEQIAASRPDSLMDGEKGELRTSSQNAMSAFRAKLAEPKP
jgi:hypothetical protein